MNKKIKKIAWGFTGAGHNLRESFEILKKVLEKGYRVDVFFTGAGKKIAQMYGIFSKIVKLKEINENGLKNIYYEEKQAPEYPICARFNLHYYDLLIISPLTSNSVSKMNIGIADTLITNIFAQMVKGTGEIFLLPCDLISGKIETEIPSGKKIWITIDEFNSQNARGLRKFPNITLFNKPKEILGNLDN